MAENVVIRPEKAADFPEIYTLVKEAFATARVSDGTEQDFVTRLRSGRNYIPELALVMEKDGVLIGQVMLTRLAIKSDKAVKALLLAPLCVALPERNRGYGQALIAEALKRAAAFGYQAVFWSVTSLIIKRRALSGLTAGESIIRTIFRRSMFWYGNWYRGC